ncbi:N-6 DNA methylase [Nocardia sp. SYP-A9097]|nr:N-6 DNA methylase [Nocardia sp. SYP-A9097]
MTATEISRLAGVTRATVSNWRRRHADFPQPIGGTEARPVFDLNEVQSWLAGHGRDAIESPITELRTWVRSSLSAGEMAQMMASLRPTDSGWTVSASDEHSSSRLLPMMDAVTEADGSRAAVDALAEYALGSDSSGGVYLTPAPVAHLMAALANPVASQRFESVLDPACGSGSLLTAAARAGAGQLYGQDVLAIQAQRAALNVEAETGRIPTVHVGDSLHADAFPGLEVDAVLCNPPSAQRDWGSESLNMADSRWDYGLPPRGESELAWVQHAIAHLRPGATGALLLPPAVAARGSGRRIRGELLRQGALRAVIGLPAGAAQPWQVALQIWVVRKPEPRTPMLDSVLFVDTAELPRAMGSGEGIDWPSVADTVITSWRAFEAGSFDAATVPGVATAVRVVEVLDDTVDLTPARFVRSSLDPGAVANQVDIAAGRLAAAVSELATASSSLREWAAPTGRSWRTATIADLASNGVLQWFRACASSSEASTTADARRVLTAPDVATGVPASGTYANSAPAEEIAIEPGDVLIPAVRSSRTGGRSARVADPGDVGAIRGPHLHLLRPTPGRSVGWFLAGFAGGSDNSSMTRTATIRFDPGRLRIPLLPLAEQQRYGESFRRLYLLRAAARRADDEAARAADLMTTGLTAGALAPPEAPDTGDPALCGGTE